MAIAQITEKCTAHSKRTGKQCGKPSIPGGRVCHWHGGNAPQVRDKARRRLLDLVDPAISTLERALILPGDEREPTQVNIAAARDILDRAGLKEAIKVDLDARMSYEDDRLQSLSDEELSALASIAGKLATARSDSSGIEAPFETED